MRLPTLAYRSQLATRGKATVKNAVQRAGWTVMRSPIPAYHVVRVISEYEADCVLDVGANRGQFGSSLRRAGYRGPLISFEPGTEAVRDLRSVARSDPMWEVRAGALADRPGTGLLNVAASSSVSSLLRPTPDYLARYAGATITRTEEVSLSTLDAIAQDLPYRRLFVKIDAQGFDLRVLQGGASMLGSVVGIQVELSVVPLYDEIPDYVTVLTHLRDRGFTPSGLFPVTADDRMRVYEFDGVFVRTY
jgi:FkbM family methyltransferase